VNSEDIIKGIFRPVIGFFLGMALAYTFQLAQSAGWVFAIGWLVFIALLFGAVLLFQRFLDWGFDKLTGWGLKKQMRPMKAETPHWFVRFGWVFGVVIGFATVMVFPEEIKALL